MPIDLIARIDNLPFDWVVALFLAAAAVICVVGTKLTEVADRIADRTGMGEAVTGAILLGIATSFPGTVTSMVTAYNGHADLAFSNAVGGIAAQTAFLALADIVYRKANLEHAAASVVSLTQAIVLIILLAVPLVAASGPDWTLFAIHPATVVLFAIYVAGTRMTIAVRDEPMWRPRQTPQTRLDMPDEEEAAERAGPGLFATFAAMAAVIGVAGWLIAETATQISARAGIAESVVGALMTAVATSLPELVTTIMAVRRGALQLAVGGIIGGNTFDVLFLSASDIAYRDGSLYHAISDGPVFWTAISLAMCGVLMLGLLRRERYGVANIGFESAGLLGIYLFAVGVSVVAA